MNWKQLFGAEIVTAADREKLEQLDKSTKPLRDLAAKIQTEWPDSMGRIGRITELAEKLAQKPTDESLYHAMTIAACMPSSLQSGYQHRGAALSPIERKIDELLAPGHAIVRKCLRRALEQAEAELRKQETAERRSAESESYDYVPSGRVLALQKKILSLRNEVARPVFGEEGFSGGDHWKNRLSEYL